MATASRGLAVPDTPDVICGPHPIIAWEHRTGRRVAKEIPTLSQSNGYPRLGSAQQVRRSTKKPGGARRAVIGWTLWGD